jgi:hypothetical protein
MVERSNFAPGDGATRAGTVVGMGTSRVRKWPTVNRSAHRGLRIEALDGLRPPRRLETLAEPVDGN